MKHPGQAGLLATSSRGFDVYCRAFYAVVGATAVFVGTVGLLLPRTLARTFSWLVLPPLHARFLGVLYLFGAVYLFCCTASRRRSHSDPALATVFIFTGILGLLTFLNLKAFDYGAAPAWVWTAAYVLYPIGAVALAWLTRRVRAPEATRGPPLLGWARSLLFAQAAAFGATGVLLLVARTLMVHAWPWTVTKLLAQSYACAFLSFAWFSLRYGSRNRAADLPVFLPAMLVLTGATLAVSTKYHNLFSTSRASTWVWFGGFGAFLVGLVGVGAATVLARAPSRRHR